jgi:LmbE family N-acetylglucosaminyl deacetylase
VNRLALPSPSSGPLRLLVVGAHADDIEIGCGGTILRLIEERPDLSVTWVVLAAHGVRADEARDSAAAMLEPVGRSSVRIHGFRDGFLPFEGAAVKEVFEELKGPAGPDLILTHRREDAHQDHRLVSELTWQTFRDHLILEYEIPKYDGDFGTPNVFVCLDEAVARRKVETITQSFPTQQGRQWFSPDLFLAVLRLRGMEANAPSKYAEAFYGRKLTIG